MKMTKKLSIVIPIYNEEEIIVELHNRILKAASKITSNFELIFVNDGSEDNSLIQLKKICKDKDHSNFIDLSRNFGHQIAVSAGLDYSKGDAVVIIDGDLQDPPELIPKMYSKYLEGYDVVYAKRVSREGESAFKKLTAKIFYRTLRRMTSIDIPLDTGDFRLMDRKIVDALKKMPEKSKFLRGQVAWLGFKQTAVTFKRDKRKFGKTGYPLSKMLKFAMDGITGFSNKPLTFVTRAGFIISLFSIAIIIYAIFSYFILKQTITGWASLIISSTFIGGVQLVSIGIIGEYISRINQNVLDRPLYLVQETDILKTKK